MRLDVVKTSAALAALGLALAGCGGGGSGEGGGASPSSSLQVAGTAATGAALAGATGEVK